MAVKPSQFVVADMGALVTAEARNMDLVRRTVAKDCDPAEFDQFIHICRAVGLDPLRRQIYAFVFGKDDPSKRRMSVVTAIDGYRAIAERTKCYRPDERAPRIEYSDAAKCSSKNPLGLVRAEVTVYKYSHGAWFPTVGEAYWDEYAPIIEGGEGGFEWVDTGQYYPKDHPTKAGKPKRKKVPIGDVVECLDPSKPNWRKMGRVMIAKCAEAQALRRAWPDDFAGLEVDEEVDRRASIDLTASELAEEGASAKRFELIGGPNCITIDWCDGEPLRREPVGQFGDKVLKLIKEQPDIALIFEDRNRDALKEYWALDKSGALAVKAAYEKLKSETRSQEAAE
ncbi:MAG: phage recombination protein Bet [Polyangiaceae bacterium]|nr:phage recombination protein Bet [Polyangiaceae bacterium]